LLLLSCVASFSLMLPDQGITNQIMPSVLLNSKNAAKPNTHYPMTGLGLHGSGWKPHQKMECWHYPSCCTQDWCPSINATRDWLKLGGWRVDTGYPYGDISPIGTPKYPYGTKHWWDFTCGGWKEGSRNETQRSGRKLLGHVCDAEGTRIAFEQSGVPREDLFITVKSGFAGPMTEINKPYIPGIDHGQADYELNWLGLEYADLYLMHEGDLGAPGNFPDFGCFYPTPKKCRLDIWLSCLDWMEHNKTRACGVANWELPWLQELVEANATLPAVVQMKFHLHQSFASPRIAAIKAFCDEHDIVFNGYSPMGRSDWTTFEPEVGAPTLLEEPIVQQIANRMNKSAGQILLRWHVQQNIPTQPRSMDPAHMKENLDVFNWDVALSEEDMTALGSMRQCNGTRGNPFDPADPEFGTTYEHMIGPMLHC